MTSVNAPVPNLQVQRWVQGKESNIDRERGRVILIAVFQINCPGCFLDGIPEAIKLSNRFKDRELVVWGLATAFEDFEINTLENLEKLIRNREVVGETLTVLTHRNMLIDGRLPYEIPFPTAWDRLVKNDETVREESLRRIILRDFPNYPDMPPKYQTLIAQQVGAYLRERPYHSATFDMLGLQGTPSAVLIDKTGILRYKFFGSGHDMESRINTLLKE
ncbi:MAG: peroxiredoxin family protein [Nitrospinales bacterium]